MMECTDRHCRVLHRLLSRHARLYTEMVTAEAILHGKRDRLLGFSEIEHPVALQLGGAEPAKLAQAARIGADFGYDEINLNVGCPSDRVQSGQFGACLMREPALVADCVAAMRAAVKTPVTVKCRIGVDDQDPHHSLRALVDACAQAGVTVFAVHARKAWLAGLSPRDNRDVPPLDYELVYALKRERPDLTIIVNGGIGSLDDAETHLAYVDGVMMGRAAYQTPALLADVDARFFGTPTPPSPFQGEGNLAGTVPPPERARSGGGHTARDIDAAVEEYLEYVAAKLKEGVPLNAMTRHMLGLFHGQPGARLFRRHLSENATRPGANIQTLRDALAYLRAPHREAA
jgi:tRNA-dihydrouridine synthase A